MGTANPGLETSNGSGCYKKYALKPVPQKLSGLVKDRVSGNRGLMPAPGVLIRLTEFTEIGVIVAGPRATKTMRPFTFDQVP